MVNHSVLGEFINITLSGGYRDVYLKMVVPLFSYLSHLFLCQMLRPDPDYFRTPLLLLFHEHRFASWQLGQGPPVVWQSSGQYSIVNPAGFPNVVWHPTPGSLQLEHPFVVGVR